MDEHKETCSCRVRKKSGKANITLSFLLFDNKFLNHYVTCQIRPIEMEQSLQLGRVFRHAEELIY